MTIKRRLYANNAKTTLALDITPSDTTIQVTDGSLFPTPALGEYFLATLEFGSSIEIVKVTGKSGNTFTGCVRGQEDKPALSFQAGIKVGNRVTRDTLRSFESGVGLMDRLDSVDILDTPTKSNTNAYICHSKDSSGNSSVAIKNSDTAWRFLTHSTVAVTGNVDSANAFSIVSSAIGNKLISIVPGKYIVQFMTGNNRGLCRSVTAVSNNGLGWFTALPEFPAVNDQFEVYMSDSSTLGDGTGIIPITSGGTGGITAPVALSNLGAVAKAGDTLTGAINFAAPVTINVANASTVATTNSNNITINGAGTITALGSIPAGAVRLLTFNGIVTFTHNPTSLILPTSANIITAAGDTATVVSIGGGNWKCTSFQKFNGQPLVGINSTEYVQQGGGAGQGTNKVYVGFATAGGLKATVDSTDQGYFVFSGAKDSITTWMPFTTTGVVTASGFIGNGVSLTNVNAVNTNSISNATDKQYGWTGVQYFYSNSQTAVAAFGPPNTSLRVSDKTSGTSAAAMTFVRENLYGINMGLGVNNNFVIGGYSVNGNLLTLSQVGDLVITGTVSGTSIYGNGSNLTGLTSTQITNALAFTPVQQGGGTGQTNNKIRIGYREVAGVAGLGVQVDSIDLGFVAFSRSGNAFSTPKQIITDSSVTASYFTGSGGGLTNVVAADTASITSALNKSYKWAGTTQVFPSYAQTGIWEGTNASTHSQLHVAGNSTSAATMTFIREGLYAVNVGLDIDNAWGVGGYSAGAGGRLMAISSSGDFAALNSVTTKKYYGDISSTTGMTSGQVTTALGFTPINSSGVGPGGQLDIGKYLDFRLTAVDYDARIECTTPGKLRTWGHFEVANNLDVYGAIGCSNNITSQADIVAVGKFVGNGVGLTNVTAVNTSSILGAVDKVYTWSKPGQIFTSTTLDLSLKNGSTGLNVVSYDGSSPGMAFVRNGVYGLCIGLNTNNDFVIGGYTSTIVRLALNTAGDLSIAGTYSGAGFSGNGAGLSNVTAANTASIAGSVNKTWTWTAIQKFQCNGLSTTLAQGEPPTNLRVTSPGAGAATMSFIRDGIWGINIGLDTDNSFNIGGFSTGAMSRLTTTGNYSVPGSITAGTGGFIGLGSGITGLTAAQITNALGFKPVRMGEPTAGQGGNIVYIGWGATGGGIKIQVDNADQGYVAMSGTNPVNGNLNFNQKITSLGFIGDGYGLTGVTAVNTLSVAGALGGSWYWRNINTFASYRNINAPQDSGGLIVSAEPGVGAIMTFLRSGSFALNMGIDADNVFKLGGYSVGASTLISVDTSGNFSALGNITAYSDRRIKKDIEPIRNALDTILKLKGVTFNRISDGKKGRGFIAQEVEEVYPELVHTEVSGEHMKSVAYGNFSGDIVEALRELNDRLTAIEKRLEDK